MEFPEILILPESSQQKLWAGEAFAFEPKPVFVFNFFLSMLSSLQPEGHCVTCSQLSRRCPSSGSWERVALFAWRRKRRGAESRPAAALSPRQAGRSLGAGTSALCRVPQGCCGRLAAAALLILGLSFDWDFCVKVIKCRAEHFHHSQSRLLSCF